jgi:hypothetical protein
MRKALARRVCASQQRTQDKIITHEERLRCRIMIPYVAYIFLSLRNDSPRRFEQR